MPSPSGPQKNVGLPCATHCNTLQQSAAHCSPLMPSPPPNIPRAVAACAVMEEEGGVCAIEMEREEMRSEKGPGRLQEWEADHVTRGRMLGERGSERAELVAARASVVRLERDAVEMRFNMQSLTHEHLMMLEQREKEREREIQKARDLMMREKEGGVVETGGRANEIREGGDKARTTTKEAAENKRRREEIEEEEGGVEVDVVGKKRRIFEMGTAAEKERVGETNWKGRAGEEEREVGEREMEKEREREKREMDEATRVALAVRLDVDRLLKQVEVGVCGMCACACACAWRLQRVWTLIECSSKQRWVCMLRSGVCVCVHVRGRGRGRVRVSVRVSVYVRMRVYVRVRVVLER